MFIVALICVVCTPMFVYIETYFLSEHTPLYQLWVLTAPLLSVRALLVDRALTDNNFWSYCVHHCTLRKHLINCYRLETYWRCVHSIFLFLKIVQYILYRNSIHGTVCIYALLGENMHTHVLLIVCSSVIYVWTTPVEHQGMGVVGSASSLSACMLTRKMLHARLGFTDW